MAHKKRNSIAQRISACYSSRKYSLSDNTISPLIMRNLSTAARASLPPSDPLHVAPHTAILGLEATINTMQDQINTIRKDRSQQRLDQQWKTSKERFILVVVSTYVCIWLYLRVVLGLPNAGTSAVVPTLGYILSVVTFSKCRDYKQTRSQQDNTMMPIRIRD